MVLRAPNHAPQSKLLGAQAPQWYQQQCCTKICCELRCVADRMVIARSRLLPAGTAQAARPWPLAGIHELFRRLDGISTTFRDVFEVWVAEGAGGERAPGIYYRNSYPRALSALSADLIKSRRAIRVCCARTSPILSPMSPQAPQSHSITSSMPKSRVTSPTASPTAPGHADRAPTRFFSSQSLANYRRESISFSV